MNNARYPKIKIYFLPQFVILFVSRYPRYEDDYKFHRYTNRYGNAFGSEFYTIRITCRWGKFKSFRFSFRNRTGNQFQVHNDRPRHPPAPPRLPLRAAVQVLRLLVRDGPLRLRLAGEINSKIRFFFYFLLFILEVGK